MKEIHGFVRSNIQAFLSWEVEANPRYRNTGIFIKPLSFAAVYSLGGQNAEELISGKQLHHSQQK